MTDVLDHKIRSFLVEVVDAAPPPPDFDALERIDVPTRRHMGRAITVVVVIVIAVVVTATWWGMTSGAKRPRISAGDGATTLPDTTTSLPAAVTGHEVPLTEVSTEESDRLIRSLQRSQPENTGYVVVQIPDRAPVVIYRDATSRCMIIAASPVPAAGDQGACISQQAAAEQIFGVLDTGPVELPTTLAYGVWAAVPTGTAYVTFTYGAETTWQRPVEGTSYFVIPGSRPSHGSEPITVRAYDARGNELGHATRIPHQDGAGDWRW